MNASIKATMPLFHPPSLDSVKRANAPARKYFSPQFFGLENVDPLQPALYVCNHTIYGFLDGPLIFEKLFEEKGIVLRALGDHAHFKIPLWGNMLKRSGAVPGTPENCTQLMQNHEHILVYPGGGREVAKRKGEEHKLTWKTRTGFARMAIEHQYPIIPVAALGADDAYDVVWDAYDFMGSKLGKWLLKNKKVNETLRGGDMVMPVAKGIGPTLIPKPEKFYFSFGEPIDTHKYLNQERDKEMQWQLRKEVMDSIEKQLHELKCIRAADRDVSALRRFFTNSEKK